MSIELKIFPGAYFPKDKALKKCPELTPLAISVQALNKSVAESIMMGKLAEFIPEHMEDYFKAKIWEHEEPLPLPPIGEFSSKFFNDSVVWDAEAGKPKPTTVMDERTAEAPKAERTPAETETKEQYELRRRVALGILSRTEDFDLHCIPPGINSTAQNMRTCSKDPEYLDWCYALKTMTGIFDRTEYEVIALIKEAPPAIWMKPEAYAQYIESSLMNDQGGVINTERLTPQTKIGLEYEIALGLLARSRDFNIYSPIVEIDGAANVMMNKNDDPEFVATVNLFLNTPGCLDYSRACNVAAVKTTPEGLWKDPAAHRAYLSKVMTETDHAHPDALIVDIACGRSSVPMPQITLETKTDDEAKPPVPGKDVATTGSQSNDVHNEAEHQPATLAETRPDICAREIEIAHALNDLISGRTNIMSAVEAEIVIACTGHLPSIIIPLLMIDIATTEFCLSPDFDDEEIHGTGMDILDAWSDSEHVRQKLAMDSIVEWRRSLKECGNGDSQAEPVKPLTPLAEATISSPVSFHQQLIIAALQGLCANPAYCGSYDDIPVMAMDLARGIICAQDADSTI
jgi:exodeoxyribonuclease VIII